MSLGRIVNISIIVIILSSVLLLLFLIKSADSLLGSTRLTLTLIEAPLEKKNSIESTVLSTINSDVLPTSIAQMFYTPIVKQNISATYPKIEEIEAEIKSPEIKYNDARLSYLGSLNENGQPKHLIKDNLYNDVFSIGVMASIHGFNIIEYNGSGSYIILGKEDEYFYIEIK